VEMNID